MSNDRLEAKVDKIIEDVGEIKVIMERNTSSLGEHMRRTDLLEKKLEPVEKHVMMMNGILKFIGLIGILVGIYAAFK